MTLEDLKKELEKKEEYREKVKAELYGITGQIQMLLDMIKKEEKLVEDPEKQ